jgi:uncharacterized protein (TIGR00255 family)
MVYSMTGFASQKISGFLVEIQTINKKGAEISLSLPRSLASKENFIRKKVGSLLSRGHASIKIFSENNHDAKVSLDACLSMHHYLKEIASSLDPTYVVTFDMVLQAVLNFDVSKKAEEDHEWEGEWEEGLNQLWQKLLLMREKEGEILAKDILLRLELIDKAVAVLEKANEGAPEFFGNKILERLEALKTINEADRERVLREVMIYAEKVDITEEVVRMRSHIMQLEKLVKSSKEPIGRTIDFLLQEMMREANTMGSKAPGVLSMNEVIFIKGEIEKIRQQGNNIE